MPSGRDQDRVKGSTSVSRHSKSHRDVMRALWVPVPEAPANDNEPRFFDIVRAFFARHINWLIPTIGLAALSIILLLLNR